jgi:RHS repeat-associated protein
VDAAGNIRAHYEYSPFGEIVIQSGDLAHTFTHRFSTKPFDAETGLVIYQLRPYVPGLGRWMNRDPIGERGGDNLYGFVGNGSVNRWDMLGLEPVSVEECHAVLIVGHAKRNAPIEWEFPESGCAYGGMVGCWPSENNPEGECRWPNLPIHNDRIFSGGWLFDLFTGQVQQGNVFDENYREEDWEHDAQRVVENAWSKVALGAIEGKLCGKKCCCEKIVFEIRITQGKSELRKAIKKFNWQPNTVRTIILPCKKGN